MKIKDVISALECFAPLPLQEDWDNAGLQVGLTEAEVSGALLCLDVTEKVVDEAIGKGCNLIVSHHPLIFRRLRQVAGKNDVQRTVIKAIKHDITIVSLHTNLDAAQGGVNHEMARMLHLDNVRYFAPQVKAGIECGIGVIGELETPLAPEAFIALVKETFHCGCVVTNPLLHRDIRRVACAGGSCEDFLPQAISAGADAFITGEMHYHSYFDHDDEIQIAVIGHYESEQFTQQLLKRIIEKECPDIVCHITTVMTNPLRYH